MQNKDIAYMYKNMCLVTKLHILGKSIKFALRDDPDQIIFDWCSVPHPIRLSAITDILVKYCTNVAKAHIKGH